MCYNDTDIPSLESSISHKSCHQPRWVDTIVPDHSFDFAWTKDAPLFSCSMASRTMSSTICCMAVSLLDYVVSKLERTCAGLMSLINAATRPMSHGRVDALFSGCCSISWMCGMIPFEVSSLISAWRLVSLRQESTTFS